MLVCVHAARACVAVAVAFSVVHTCAKSRVHMTCSLRSTGISMGAGGACGRCEVSVDAFGSAWDRIGASICLLQCVNEIMFT
jgi:hypothetical protein